MKKIIITLCFGLFILNAFSQDVTYKITDQKFDSEDGIDFYEFNIMISSQNKFQLHSGQLYFNYKTSTFGENIVTNLSLIHGVSEEELLLKKINGQKLFKPLIANDNTTSRFSLSWQNNTNCEASLNENLIDHTEKLLLKLRIKLPSPSKDLPKNTTDLICFEYGEAFDDQTYLCTGNAQHQITNDLFLCPECIDENEDGVCDDADTIPPTSKISSIPTETNLDSVVLNWLGKDNEGGVGIKGYELYVSENNGPFELMISTIDTTYVFYGDNGKKYSFFTLAIDSANNKEPIKNEGDVEITFTGQKSITILTPNFGDEVCPGDSLNISWTSDGIELVNIYLFNLNDTIYSKIESKVNAKNGKISWVVPHNLSGVNGNQIVVLEDSNVNVADTSGQFLVFKTYNQTETVETCMGASYTFPDGRVENNITEQVTHTSILQTQNGCDSLITTMVNPVLLDTSIIVEEPKLTANAIDVGYQWINCKDSLKIAGATEQSFIASEKGAYAVILTKGLCSDTSFCYNIISTSINNSFLGTKVALYPNPFTQTFTINFGKVQEKVKIAITSVLGEELYLEELENLHKINMPLNAPKGIYFVKIILGDQSNTYKILKE